MLAGCEQEGVVNISISECDAAVVIKDTDLFTYYHTFICNYSYIGYGEHQVIEGKDCNYIEYSGDKCKSIYVYKKYYTHCPEESNPYYNQMTGKCIGCPSDAPYPTGDGKCSPDYSQKGSAFVWSR